MKVLDKIQIVENSVLARIARSVRKADSIAMVIGNKIYLSGASREEFLREPKWVKHELMHIRQFKKYGTLRFLFLYLVESIRKGYYNNKFEKEAREGAEANES